ncbi:hypothetical protein ACLM5H_05505 [Fredinandcohnia humi]
MSGKKTKRTSKIFRIFFTTILGLLVFFLTYTISQSMEEKKNEEIVKEQAKQVEKEKKTKQDVQMLLTKMKEENEKYDVYARAYAEKWIEKDIKGVHEEASKAYEQAKKLENYYSTYKVPAEVPEHVLTLFEGLGSDLSVAFAVRAEAFELVLKHLDSKDPSNLKHAEEKFTESNSYFLSGSENIDMIQTQMGITLEKQK